MIGIVVVRISLIAKPDKYHFKPKNTKFGLPVARTAKPGSCSRGSFDKPLLILQAKYSYKNTDTQQNDIISSAYTVETEKKFCWCF